MSEIDEETIAGIVRSAMLSDPRDGTFRERLEDRTLISTEAARQILALVLPAIERARVEEREDGLRRQTTALAQAQEFRRLYEEGVTVVGIYGSHDKMTDTAKLEAIVYHPHFAGAHIERLRSQIAKIEAAAPLSARETAEYLRLEQKLAVLEAAAIRKG